MTTDEKPTEDTVEKIVQTIDESTMLGAGWDCMSQTAKDRFRNRLKRIIDESRCSPISHEV